MIIKTISCSFLILMLVCTAAFSQTYLIGRYVVAAGGGITQDGANKVQFTLGQPSVGVTGDALFGVRSGFLAGGGSLTGVEEPPELLPGKFQLLQNYPNPFNPSTIIRYDVPERAFVSLKIYNVVGSEVATLVHGIQDAGYKSVEWNAEGFPSGVYFYRLYAGGISETKKLVLLR